MALRDVERAVCELFQVDADALKSDSRARALAYPRMMAMYLARKHTGAAYSEIGRYFGGRNHSTVISAEKKVLGWLRDEERSSLLPGFETVADLLADLERSLGTLRRGRLRMGNSWTSVPRTIERTRRIFPHGMSMRPVDNDPDRAGDSRIAERARL